MTVGFKLFDQRGRLITQADVKLQGWTPLHDIKAGMMGHPEGLVFWNACPGAGELNIGWLELDFGAPVRGVLPTARWRTDGSKLVIGAGGEFMPVRGSLRVRWGYEFTAPRHVAYGPSYVSWHPDQRRDVMGKMMSNRSNPNRLTGMIPTTGEFQTAPPGGTDKNSIAGWEQDGPGMVERSDQWMNRMHVGCCEQDTGVALLIREESYNLVVGMNKETTLDTFCKSFAIYDDRRSPNVMIRGDSQFAWMLRGDNRDLCQSTMDGQHRGNALGAVRAAAQCGDSIAQRDLLMLANDAAMANQSPSSFPIGERDMGWRIDAWAHARRYWPSARYWTSTMGSAQTKIGALLRAPADYAFSPTPQSYGCASDIDCDSTMYRMICLYAAGLLGRVDIVRKGLEFLPWPAPKFVEAGRRQTEVFDTKRGAWGPPDYFGHLGIGCLAVLDKHATDWHAWACKQPTPDGQTHTSIGALLLNLRRATRGFEQTAVLRAVLEEILA